MYKVVTSTDLDSLIVLVGISLYCRVLSCTTNFSSNSKVSSSEV